MATERAAAARRLLDAEKEHCLARRNAQRMRERQEQRQASGKRAGRRSGIGKMAAGNLQRAAEASTGRLGDRHAAKIASAAEAVLEAREDVPLEETISIDLTYTAVPSRRHLVELQAVNVRYPGAARDVWPEPLNLSIVGPERIALSGPNGSGKSSLLGLIKGTVAPSVGRRKIGARSVALLDQRASNLDPAVTLLENAVRAAPGRPVQETRLLLARLLFEQRTVEKCVGVLSGGERMRAALACLLCRDQAPDLLLLDEPTNNLDLPSVEEVIAMLNAYRGALVVVSHDAWFLDRVGVERTICLDP